MTLKLKICFYLILATLLLATFSVKGQDKADEGFEDSYEETYVDPYFQEDNQFTEFSEDQINDARKGIEFYKDYKTEEEEEELESINYSNDGLGSFATGLIKTIFIIGLIAIIVLVLFNMIGDGKFFKPKSKKITGSVTATDLEEIEDNLEESDIESFLKKALEDKDYKVAIRLYFLIAIRDLSKNKFIKWKKDKTNRDYIRETRALDFGDHFRETANIYEKAWYGDFDVMYSDFNTIEKKFIALIDKIKIKKA